MLLCILHLLCCIMLHCVANVALNMLKGKKSAQTWLISFNYPLSMSHVTTDMLCILHLLRCVMLHCVALNMLKEINKYRHG